MCMPSVYRFGLLGDGCRWTRADSGDAGSALSACLLDSITVWLVGAGVSLRYLVFVWSETLCSPSSSLACDCASVDFPALLPDCTFLCPSISSSFSHFLCPVTSHCGWVATTSSAAPAQCSSHNQILNKSGTRERAYVTEEGRRVPVALSPSEQRGSEACVHTRS